jgi:hypothetical protein
MKTRIKILDTLTTLLLGLVLFFLSCKNNSTGPDADTGVDFKITVKDIAGNPINGLRVSAWLLPSIGNSLSKISTSNQLNKTNNTLAISSINFSIAANAYVLLTSFNLRNQKIDTLIESALQSGQHKVSWYIPYGIPSGAFIIRLIASNDTIHFQDSIYAVYNTADPEQNVIGWTTQTGIFESTDAFLFHINLDLAPFVYTNQSGPDSLGTFKYTDTVAIVLTDSNSHKQQEYHIAIGKQPNNYDLIWSPSNTSAAFIKQVFYPETKRQSIVADDTAIIRLQIPLKWKLYQNYPNPFN